MGSSNNGNFIIVWRSSFDERYDDIYDQLFNATGVPIGSSNFNLNAYDSNYLTQSAPSIVMNDNGNFIVGENEGPEYSYESRIWAQRYNSSGILEDSFRVDEPRYYDPTWSVSIALNGKFVVVWLDNRTSGGTYYYRISGQRYNTDGTPQGSSFAVNPVIVAPTLTVESNETTFTDTT